MVIQDMLFAEMPPVALPVVPAPADDFRDRQALLQLLKAHAAARNPAPLELTQAAVAVLVRYIAAIEDEHLAMGAELDALAAVVRKKRKVA
jgi:hypothetical protein